MSDNDEKNYFHKPRKLIPHTTGVYVVIVPYLGSSSISLSAVLYDSPLFTVWCACLIYFVVVRLVIRCFHSIEINRNELIYIPFNTIGLSFGTTAAGSVRTRSESIVIVFIAISSIFTGILCSGILLQSFVVSSSRPTINSLEDIYKFPNLTFMSNTFINTYILDYKYYFALIKHTFIPAIRKLQL